MEPTVSIIMPCFNAVAYLPRSVGSVQAQTFAEWELIAVNDGSTDESEAWLKRQDDRRLRLVSQSNQGVSAARNAGLKLARGRYIAFLDADDAWANTFLEDMTRALESRAEAVLAYCGWQNVGLAGPRGEGFIPPNYENPDKSVSLFASCRWPIHAALARRADVLAVGGFKRHLKNAEDYALWLELSARGALVLVPHVLAFYYFHGGAQASNNHARAALHHLSAQIDHLRHHPDLQRRLGRAKTRDLVYGELLKRGYQCYWARNLPDARVIFRKVMQAGYGSISDWRYLLPSLLPLSLHRRLIRLFDKSAPTPPRQADR